MYCDLWSQYINYSREDYSRAKTIWGNTVSVHSELSMFHIWKTIKCFVHISRKSKTKSKGFIKAVNGQCHFPARSYQHLNFCFPSKKLYWLRSQYWETSAGSLNFSQLFFSIFLSSSKMCAKIQIVFTLARLWYWPFTAFLKSFGL